MIVETKYKVTLINQDHNIAVLKYLGGCDLAGLLGNGGMRDENT